MDSKLLSDCGELLVIDSSEKEHYQIEIEKGDYLVVEVGAIAGKPSSKFVHPNIAATEKQIYEFKHYRAKGSKFWTRKAGISFFFVIPRTAVRLLFEKGYSYIRAEINGVKVSFNVSGGTGNGWTDWLHTRTQISVNHKFRDLKKIAEVAIRNSPLEPIIVKKMDKNQEKRWQELVAKANPKIKERIVKLIEEGKCPMIYFLDGYTYGGEIKGEGIEVWRSMKRVNIDATRFTYEEKGRVTKLILACGWGQIRAKMSQINWQETALVNGVNT